MFDKNIKTIYFIGIKGVGMTMLAQFLSQSGYRISGSDVSEVFMTDKVLKDSKIKVFSGFSEDNLKKLKNIDLVIYSSAYKAKTNKELALVLKEKKIPSMSYAQALAKVFNSYKGIAVVGSHGKTTVSAWLAFVLQELKQEPNALVGARVAQLAGSGLKGKSEYLVAEVDEYQNKLQYFNPFAVVLNNIDWDHHDYFKTFAQYLEVFITFIKKIPEDGFLVYNYDDINCRKVAKYCKARKIAFSLGRGVEIEGEKEKNDKNDKIDILEIKNKLFLKGKANFSFSFAGSEYSDYSSSLAGEHNLSNSLAVLLSAKALGLSLEKIKPVLNKFTGPARRQEFLGEYKECLIIDDYAHHPTEIQKTIEALKNQYEKRKLIILFHPHTYTRTKMLLKEFSESFVLADRVLILNIYGSAREKKGGTSSKELVEKIRRYNIRKNIKQEVVASGDIKETSDFLKKEITEKKIEKAVIVLMGAGDVFRVAEDLLS